VRPSAEWKRFSEAMIALLALATALLVVPIGFAQGAVNSLSRSKPITETTHIAYLSCNKPGVLLTASIPRRTFQLGQNIVVTASIRNLTKQTCGYPGQPNVAPTSVLTIGGCNHEIAWAVDTILGRPVYVPGPPASLEIPAQAPCAAQLPPLPPGATMTGTVVWNQVANQSEPARYTGTKHAILAGQTLPRGQYILYVDVDVPNFAIQLTGGSKHH
jgi:hypothetical protein